MPLRIPTESLEQTAQDRTKAACALITTYERDSIWQNEGLVQQHRPTLRNRSGSFTVEGDGIATRKSILQKHSDSCKIRPVPSPSGDRCCLLALQVRQ